MEKLLLFYRPHPCTAVPSLLSNFVISLVHHLNASAGDSSFIFIWCCPLCMRDITFPFMFRRRKYRFMQSVSKSNVISTTIIISANSYKKNSLDANSDQIPKVLFLG
jgi:hypothetical protein